MASEINEKHLDLIQGVVNRLASNSFLLKGWNVTLVAALLALAADAPDPRLDAIALLPALVFWGLDGYFLAQERLFRDLYGRVIVGAADIPPYSMKTGSLSVKTWLEVCWSITLWPFHGAVLVTVLTTLFAI